MKKNNLCDVKAAMFDLGVELDDKMLMKVYKKEPVMIFELSSQRLSSEDVYYTISVSYDNNEEVVTDVTLLHVYPSLNDIGDLTYDNKDLRLALINRLKYLFKVDNVKFKTQVEY